MPLEGLFARAKDRLVGDRRESAITRGAAPDRSRENVARRKARALRQRARDVDGQTVRQAARRAGQQFEGVEASASGTQSRRQYEREVSERAERSATMADPIGVTLEPADPQGVDEFARGGAAQERPEDEDAAMGVGLADPNEGSVDDADDGLLDFGGDRGDAEADDDWLRMDDDEGWF